MAIPRSTATEIAVERLIPASPAEAFDCWLDPAVPGSPWHEHEELTVDTRPGGLWFWRSLGGTPHYGRFAEISRPHRTVFSWMSPNTLGEESRVEVRFEAKDNGTLVTVCHSGLPNEQLGQAHNVGWTAILERIAKTASRQGRELT